MALTANVGSSLAAKFGNIQSYTAGGVIWRGAIVVLRLATADDKVYAAVDDPTDTYKQLVVGFAQEAAVAEGSIRVRQDGKLKLKFAAAMPDSVIGRLACIKDDENVQLYGESTCKVAIGRITERATSTEVYVNLVDRPTRLATSLLD